MRQIAAFLRKYVPGFERSYVAQSGVTIGVRETRRVTGDYALSAQDILGGQKFEDAIARGLWLGRYRHEVAIEDAVEEGRLADVGQPDDRAEPSTDLVGHDEAV